MSNAFLCISCFIPEWPSRRIVLRLNVMRTVFGVFGWWLSFILFGYKRKRRYWRGFLVVTFPAKSTPGSFSRYFSYIGAVCYLTWASLDSHQPQHSFNRSSVLNLNLPYCKRKEGRDGKIRRKYCKIWNYNFCPITAMTRNTTIEIRIEKNDVFIRGGG